MELRKIWIKITKYNFSLGVDEVSMMTSLQSTSAVKETLRALVEDVMKVDLKRHHRILDEGMEEDDYKESILSLRSLMDNYDDGSGPL